MLFVGWEVRVVKNCDRVLETAAEGSIFKPDWSQFFTIRTDPKAANNLFFSCGKLTYKWVCLIVTKTPHEYIRVTYEYIGVIYEYIRVTYEYIVTQTMVAIWRENMLGYLSADIICSEKRAAF